MGFATLKGLLSYQIGFGGRRWLYLWFQPTLGTEKRTAHGWSGTYYYIVIHIYQFLLFLIKDYRLANMMGLSSQLEGSYYKYLEVVSRQDPGGCPTGKSCRELSAQSKECPPSRGLMRKSHRKTRRPIKAISSYLTLGRQSLVLCTTQGFEPPIGLCF